MKCNRSMACRLFGSLLIPVVICSARLQAEVVDFEDLSLSAESYWNGSDNSGQFTSGSISFTNAFTDWVAMPNGDGAGSYPHNNITMNLNGVLYIDNVQLSPPDPAPLPAPSYGASNPERFEYYASTTDWQPSQAVEGWTLSTGLDDLAKIGSAYGETGSGMELSGGAMACLL